MPVSPLKLKFELLFDVLRNVPENQRSHTFHIVVKRGSNSTRTASFQLQKVDDRDCLVRLSHQFEQKFDVASDKASYKSNMARIQVVDENTKSEIVDSSLNLSQFIKEGKVPLVKFNVGGLAPPLILVMAMRANTEAGWKAEAEAAAEKQQSPRPADVQKVAETAAASPERSGSGASPVAAARPPPPPPAAQDQPRAAPAAADAGSDEEEEEDEASVPVAVARAPERDDRRGGALGALDDETIQRFSTANPGSESGGARLTEAALDAQQQQQQPHGEEQNQPASSASASAPTDVTSTQATGKTRGTAGSDKYGAARTKAATTAAREARLKRRDERASRATLARIDRERDVEMASLSLQERVHDLLREVKNSVLQQARVEVDGAKCTIPRSAQIAIGALNEFLAQLLTGEAADAAAIGRDQAVLSANKGDDSDSDDELATREVERIARNAGRAKLPPEAPLLLFAHDLIVMLRWEVAPAQLDHKTLGAWTHTLLLLLNHVLQRATPDDVASILPLINNMRVAGAGGAMGAGSAHANPHEAIRQALTAAASEAKNAAKAASTAGRRGRRWWRSLRRPRLFGGRKQARAADRVTGMEQSAESLVPGVPTILSVLADHALETDSQERSMGALGTYSSLFHSVGIRLDAMWEKEAERLVGAGRGGSSASAAGANKPRLDASTSPEEAFPMLSTLPVNVFSEGNQPAVHRRAGKSPLFDLLRQLVAEEMPKPGMPHGPFDPHGPSPMREAVRAIGAVLAYELDMALHELLVQTMQLHVEQLPDFAFAAMAPLDAPLSVQPPSPNFDALGASGERTQSRLINEAAAHARAAEEAATVGSPAGSAPAFRWLTTALRGLYEELVASDLTTLHESLSMESAYIWTNPLSVDFASQVIRLVLEQLCVLVLNENHRRLTANLAPAPTPKKKSKDGSLPAKFIFNPVSAEGRNVRGERVFASIEDGLHLKARLDELEQWLDGLPVGLGQGTRSALLPLRSLCDLLILPSDVMLDPDTRRAALSPIPEPMQRALFAAHTNTPWEHEDDVRVGQEARNALATALLLPTVPAALQDAKNSNKNAGSLLPDSYDPSAVAMPFAIAFRTLERDFSFLDMLTLPNAFFTSAEATLRHVEAFHALQVEYAAKARDSKALKALPPLAQVKLADVDCMMTQSMDSADGQLAVLAQHSSLLRETAVTARWDTKDYRTSIGLHPSDEMRREEQLLDARRGPEHYKAPDNVLDEQRDAWDHGDCGHLRAEIRRGVASAIDEKVIVGHSPVRRNY